MATMITGFSKVQPSRERLGRPAGEISGHGWKWKVLHSGGGFIWHPKWAYLGAFTRTQLPSLPAPAASCDRIIPGLKFGND